jgi:hypothetical protein
MPIRRFPVPLAPAVMTACPLIAAKAFFWNLAEWLSVFLCGPVLALCYLATAAVLLWSLIAAFRSKGSWNRFLPAILCASALAASRLVPFDELWLKADFLLRRSDREMVIAQLRSGTIPARFPGNSSELIALPSSPAVSRSGNDILVSGSRQDPFVFFYTFRGVIDNYAGFLRVPPGHLPDEFTAAGDQPFLTEKFGDGWFFLSFH